jgi:hypothetical protein
MEHTMKKRVMQQWTTRLGDLVEAVFEQATAVSADPKEVHYLATKAVTHLLSRARKTPIALFAEGRLSWPM